jgi:hypothetical protein
LRRVYLSSKTLYQMSKSFTGSAPTSELAERRPYYLLVTGATVNREPETKGKETLRMHRRASSVTFTNEVRSD